MRTICKSSVLFLWLSLSSQYNFAQEKSHHADGVRSKPETAIASDDASPKATEDYIRIYQKFISGVRGQECPMYPSCSNFGLLAFKERSIAEAFVLTSDRLMRCGHDHRQYALTLRETGFKNIDLPAYKSTPKDLFYTRNKYSFAYADTEQDETPSSFIKELINQQYYREALLEINRIEHLDKEISEELFTNKIICLKSLEEYEKAIYEITVRRPATTRVNDQLNFEIASIYYSVENYAESGKVAVAALEHCNDAWLRPRLISMAALNNATEGKYEEAKALYANGIKEYSTNDLLLSNTKILETYTSTDLKNPTVAGLLSIIPGLGYAYSGHMQTAISALIINGLLAYATYSNIKTENYGMAALTGVFGLSFYIGNIVGGSNSAKRYNERKRMKMINQLKYNINL